MYPYDIRLFISDVDGTLLNTQKQVSPATQAAIDKLQLAGIQFSLASSRPPKGLKWLIDLLGIEAPCAALNGAVIIDSHLSVLSRQYIHAGMVQEIVETIESYGMDPWIYTEADWYVLRDNAPHVRHESDTVRFVPRLFATLSEVRDPIIKIAGVSDDYASVSSGAARLNSRFGDQLSISCSLANRLDATYHAANKGGAVIAIANELGIPLRNVATAGDGDNDIAMFRESGLSIAMGQAPPEVHRAASHTTTSNGDDGLAWAIEEMILKRL
jgi:hypothetical protein